MFEILKNWLQKPFPFVEKPKEKITVAFLFGTAIFLFLFTYEPFNVDEIRQFKVLVLLGFFAITFVVMAANFFLLPLIFPTLFLAEKWTVLKNMLLIFWIALCISFFNWLYSANLSYYCNCFSTTATLPFSLPYFLFITLSVGFFPIIFYMLLAEKFLSRKHHKIAFQVMQQLESRRLPEPQVRQVEIVSENNKENIKISLQYFLCISAEGNYINVFYEKEGKVCKELIRASLSKVEKQLSDFGQIKRCHRSYIVNLDKVTAVTGNARNYNLELKLLDFTLPVSRSFPQKIIESLQNQT
ncbi:LytTR family DNA-binding domain-containing protein [Hugenholtzia roseola]|uniref:LytTR family DNA-binding domain-containing protein n=1 Tax=Hugenholtzia roseola TaxID=1002 RepID=UPI0003FCE87D|nr:LytTR family DNA-binding domain-containing protein [Hugenholtzia roseola]